MPEQVCRVGAIARGFLAEWTHSPSHVRNTPYDGRLRLFIKQRWTRLLFDVATGQAALLQVLLVIILGCIKGRRGDDLRRNRLGVSVRSFQHLF